MRMSADKIDASAYIAASDEPSAKKNSKRSKKSQESVSVDECSILYTGETFHQIVVVWVRKTAYEENLEYQLLRCDFGMQFLGFSYHPGYFLCCTIYELSVNYNSWLVGL